MHGRLQCGQDRTGQDRCYRCLQVNQTVESARSGRCSWTLTLETLRRVKHRVSSSILRCHVTVRGFILIQQVEQPGARTRLRSRGDSTKASNTTLPVWKHIFLFTSEHPAGKLSAQQIFCPICPHVKSSIITFHDFTNKTDDGKQ